MVKSKKEKKENSTPTSDDFSAELIKELNKEAGQIVAFNLGTDEAPTNIKRWISTGSRQLDCILSNKLIGGLPEGRIVEIQGPTSCHAKGTKLLMYDGTLKKVEKIKIGDQLMGPDGTLRNVLNLVGGVDQLYEVIQKRTKTSYIFNSEHKLVLRRAWATKHGKRKGEIVHIPLKDYIKKSKEFKKCYKWFHTGVEDFNGAPKKDLLIPPYILGLLLGDGSLSSKRIELTTADSEISSAYIEEIKKRGYDYSLHERKNNKAHGIYHKTGIHIGGKLDPKNDPDSIRSSLRTLGLLDTTSGNKFIPQRYKTSSWNDRLELLAGLIDTDGYCNKGCNYDFVTKSKQLAEDVAFVVRSLGLFASFAIKEVNSSIYHRLCIYGNILQVPVRLKRKKALPHRISENFGIDVKPVSRGEFFGLTVDEDNLYLSDDFSVIHNSGKSHVMYEVAKSTQKMGGIVIYIDTENATNLDNLKLIGIDVDKRFVFVQTACTEDIFAVAESAIHKARALTKDVPVTIIWDSVAASSPKAELEGDYEQNTIGLQARVLGKGMRKIGNIIGNQNVLFLLVNQQRQKIGVQYGDPLTVPGGMAIPYASSTRIRLMSAKPIEKNGEPIGVQVEARTIKNKVATPFRKCTFSIHFGVGIVEHEEVFDLFRNYCDKAKNGVIMPNGEHVSVSGKGAWKNFMVISDQGEVLHEVKFHKADFAKKVLNVPEYKNYLEAFYEATLVLKKGMTESDNPTIDKPNMNSAMEAEAIAMEAKEK